MQIATIIEDCKDILGINNRLVIYTLGCPRHCKNCETPEFIDPNPSSDVDIISILRTMQLEKYDGVTISGGDPFFQKEELKKLVDYLSIYFDDILIYTGYKFEELQDETSLEIFKNISVLIDGEYIESLDQGERLRGSTNQRFFFFKEKYKDAYLKLNSQERKQQKVYHYSRLIGLVGLKK